MVLMNKSEKKHWGQALLQLLNVNFRSLKFKFLWFVGMSELSTERILFEIYHFYMGNQSGKRFFCKYLLATLYEVFPYSTKDETNLVAFVPFSLLYFPFPFPFFLKEPRKQTELIVLQMASLDNLCLTPSM